MAYKGDTVRLLVKFYDFDNNEFDPENITLSVYSDNMSALYSTSLEDRHRIGIGEYYYDYTIPYHSSDYLIYEFSGMKNGEPIVARNKIEVNFV